MLPALLQRVRRVTTVDLSTIVVVLSLVVVVAVVLGPSLLGLRAFHGSDILESFSPWRNDPPDAVVPTNPLVGDTVDSILPAKSVFRDSLAAGSIGWWNPYQLGGRPLASVPNESLFSPLNAAYWILPLWYAPGLVKLLEIGIAVLFTTLFVRRLGMSTATGMLAGAVFAFSGFQVVWTNWPQTHVGALIAALFWAVEYAAGERRVSAALPLAAVVAVMWFEGFPSVTGYALLFAGAYALVRTVPMATLWDRVRSLAVAGAAVAVGTALAAVQLLPFAMSFGDIDVGTREQTSAATLPLRVAATFAVPNAFGSPVDRNFFGPGNYIEIQSFIGGAALLLACVGVVYGLQVVRRSVFWYFLVSSIVALWLTFVGGLLLALFQLTPLFAINFIGRMRSVIGFLVAILAAFGFEAILRRVPAVAGSWRHRGLLVGTVAVVGGVVGFSLFRAWQMARANLELDYFWSHVAVAAALAVMGLLLVGLAHIARSGVGTAAVVGLVGIVAVEILLFARPFLPQIPVDEFYPETPSHAFLASELGSNRFAAAGLAMYPSTQSLYGMRTVTGHAFHDPDWQDLLEAVDPGVMNASPTFSIFASRADIGMSPVLDRFGVSHLVTDPRVRVLGDRRATDAASERVGDHGFVMEVPVDGTPRAVTMFLEQGADPGVQPDEVKVEALDDEGRAVAEGSRRLTKALPPGPLDIPIVDPGDAEVEVVRVVYAGDNALGEQRDAAGSVILEVVTAVSDGMTLVHASDTVVYERSTVLPRIRWAGESVVLEDPAARIDALAAGLPSDTVIVEQSGFASSGEEALVRSVVEHNNSIDVRLTADGAGFLVIADTMQRDWVAELDGREVEALPADHAFVAVAVPAGDHTVTFRYEPRGLAWGLGVSGVAALVCVGIGVGGVVYRRRHPDAGASSG